jgi:hypothetical protein
LVKSGGDLIENLLKANEKIKDIEGSKTYYGKLELFLKLFLNIGKPGEKMDELV